MPGPLTHYFCAKKTLEILKKDNIILNENAFIWGSQGPDIFFYHRFLPWNRKDSIAKVGDKYHSSSPSKHFECAAKYVREKHCSDIEYSYFMGNICHYAADRNCHPFVYCWQDIYKKEIPKREDFPWHSEIETSLDIIVLRYETGKLPTDVSLKMCAPKDKQLYKPIADYWKAVTADCLNLEISSEAAAYLAGDMRKMFGLMDNRLLMKKPILEWIEKKADKNGSMSTHLMGISEGDVDYSNSLNRVWDEKSGCNKSFLDLFDYSAADGARMIKECREAIAGGGSFLDITGDVSYALHSPLSK